MRIKFEFEKVSTVGDLDKRLARFFSRMERKMSSFREDFRMVWVNVRKERGVYRVKGKMKLPGKQIVAEEKGGNLLGVVVKVRDRLLRQIERYKKPRH